MLTAMNMNLGRLRAELHGSSSDALLAESIAINDELSRQIRTMSYLLHPPLLDEIGLASAIRWYVDGFTQRSGIKVDLDISTNFGRLSNDLEITIFRVVQECLTNIHRHSGSPTATIRLSRIPDGVRVDIIDFGSGISPEKLQDGNLARGVGFMGIEERLRQFGGTIEISSSVSGTCVTALLPVKSSATAS